MAKAIHAIGKRKTAIARVWMKPGNGRIIINRRDIDDYMIRETSKMVIRQPLDVTETNGKFDVLVNVTGGGLNGQAGAIRHAISRALTLVDADHRKPLKAAGLITRDDRKKERKLPGQPGARKRFQYSKR